MLPRRPIDTINPRLAANDLALVCDALRTIIVRLDRVAAQAGYTDVEISAMANHEMVLLNRVELSMPETKLRRTK